MTPDDMKEVAFPDPALAKLKLNHSYSTYQDYCPVCLKDGHHMSEGLTDYILSYLGSCYFFCNNSHLERFQHNPLFYVKTPPALAPKFTVALVGGPSVGKTAVSKYLKDKFGWNVINEENFSEAVIDNQTVLDGVLNTRESFQDFFGDDEGEEENEETKDNIDKVVGLFMEDVDELSKRFTEGAEDVDDVLDRCFDYQDREWPQVVSYLDDMKIAYTEVTQKEDEDLATVCEKVRAAIDPFYRHRNLNRPRRVTSDEAERSKVHDMFYPMSLAARQLAFSTTLAAQYEDPSLVIDDPEQQDALAEEATAFCPVCLIDDELLFPGSAEQTVRIFSSCYSTCTEEHLAKFQAEPDKYHVIAKPDQELFAKIPPLRLVLTGPLDSGLAEAARLLAQTLDIKQVVSVTDTLLPRIHDLVSKAYVTAMKIVREKREKKEKAAREKQAKKDAARAARKAKRDAERAARKAAAAAAKAERAGDEDEDEKSEETESEDDYSEDDISEEDSDDNSDDSEDDVDLDVLAGFLGMDWKKASVEEKDRVLAQLIEAEYISENAIDSLLIEILSNIVGKRVEGQAPSPYLLQVDISNVIILQRLCELLSTQKGFAPHVVLPLTVDDELGQNRLREKVIRQVLDVSQRHPTYNGGVLTSADDFQELGSENVSPVSLADFPDVTFDENVEVLGPFQESKTASELVVHLMSENGFIILKELKSTENPRLFRTDVIHSLDTFLQAQKSLFRRPEAVELTQANSIVSCGLASLRQYGTYCPVCLAQGKYLDCTAITAPKGIEVSPVTWYHNVIFLCSREHRQEFTKDTIKYSCLPPPHSPVATRAVVVGPALSAKSALAEALAVKLDLIYLDLEGVLESIADTDTVLSRDIKATLNRGEALDAEVVVQAIKTVTLSDECVRNGWVLDGFPKTLEQAQLLDQYQVIPHHVFSLGTPLISNPKTYIHV